ncbi:MAG: ATP synthase F1 subunit epsilon [Clostridiales bacterium]|nr:ATP synthase F1 subunit epsilon [Clostridiales bacterium]
MLNSFNLDIITPERQFFSGEIQSLIMDTPDGKRGVLAGHAPMVIALAIGQLDMMIDGKWQTAFTSEGFIEIAPGRMNIMAQTVEWPDEIDTRRAKEAGERAKERLRQKQSLNEYHTTMSSLARAMARLRVKRNINMD